MMFLKGDQMYLPIIIIAFACLINSAIAQSSKTDSVVYLKNGSEIKCNIIEYNPDSAIRVATADGSVFVFEQDDVLKIVRQEEEVLLESDSASFESQKSTYCGYFGISAPLGEFSDTNESGGFARGGYGVGVDYIYSVRSNLFYGLCMNYASFGFNKSEFRHELGLMTGHSLEVGRYANFFIGSLFGLRLVAEERVYLGALFGFSIATSPAIEIEMYGHRIYQSKITGSSYTFGLAAGFDLGENLSIVSKLFFLNPRFESEISTDGDVTDIEFRQTMTHFQLACGYRF
jgi:hypothetical protein